MPATRPLLAAGMLMAVTVVWGWTFVLVKDAVTVMPASGFLAWRFLLASLVLAVPAARHVRKESMKVGLGIGLSLGVAYALQTMGLAKTTAALTGLITGLFAVFAPLFNRLLYGVNIHRRTLVAILLGLSGLAMLTGFQSRGMQLGDLWSLGGAAAFGLHIALLDRYSARHHPQALTLAQMLGCTGFMLLLWLGEGEWMWPPRAAWKALFITSVFASALAFFLQTQAQRSLAATTVAMLLLLEPVFAVFFAMVLKGETLHPLQMMGAVVLLGGVLVESLRSPSITEPATPEELPHVP